MITRYQIGDRIHAYVHSDWDFEVEIEIQGITNFDLANQSENILIKLFNSEIDYQNLIATNTYFYVCKVLTTTQNYNVNDKIVLCDALIKENGTYYLENSFRLIVDLSYNTHNTIYKKPEDVINAMKVFFNEKSIVNTIVQDTTDQDKLEVELASLRSMLTNIKGLKELEPIIENLKAISVDNVYEKLNTQMIILLSIVNNLIANLNKV